MEHDRHNHQEMQHGKPEPEGAGSYTCPMHPEVRSDRPGMCPECGMALVKARKSGVGSGESEHRDKHAGHKTTSFLRKFWVSLVLSVPVVAYSHLAREVFGFYAPEFPGSEYLPLVLGSAIFFYGGWVFLASAKRELQARLPGMMTLIAMAVSAAYLYSIWAALFSPGSETLFWELATLITIMLLGHWLEMRAVQGAQGALKELSKLLPDTAELILNAEKLETRTIPLAELKAGDTVFIRPGGKVPADGEVFTGRSEVNEALVTGESRPVVKEKGAKVIAGSTNGDGTLQVRITEIGEHTFLSGVMRLVKEAQASKSRLQVLSDRAAFWLTLTALGAGGTAFAVWLATGAGLNFAVERLVAVLVIACPHALGLAVPLVASLSTTMAARNGFLVKQRLALEAARDVDMVIFDKTGTLTKGEYGVEEIIPAGDASEAEILKYAAAVDSHSEHVVSRAILADAKEKNISFPPVSDFERLSGRGVKGNVEGAQVFAGGEAILKDARISLDAGFSAQVREAAKGGKTVVYVVKNGRLLGAIALGDVIREESREAVKRLKDMGVKVAMLTGDSEEVASWAAQELGIDEYFARVLPQEKEAKVRVLQARGLKVAMVGDGINDAPALTRADLGIAVGAGTNVAIESAGIILVRNDPRDIPKIINLSRLTYVKMIQNLFWATGYNVIALPLAAGVLWTRGVMLEPAVAAILMSFSTVIVAVNAVMLRRRKI